MNQKQNVVTTSIRYKIGLFFIVLSCIMPFSALIIPFLGLSVANAAFATGALMFGGPEIIFFAGVLLAGKEAVKLVKNKLWKPAGKIRYRIGLIVLIFSLLANWICSYLELTEVIKPALQTQLYTMVSFDIFTVISLVIMGPEFFIKFRSIFHWEGKAINIKSSK